MGGRPDKSGSSGVGGRPDKSGSSGGNQGKRPDKAGSNESGGGRPDRLAKPCYSERVCQFVDDKIAELRESVRGAKFCLRDVCKAAKEGVDEFEKFVRGRRGSDPRKVAKFKLLKKSTKYVRVFLSSQLIGGVLTHLTTAGAKKCISEEKEDIAKTLGITKKYV